MPTKSLLSEANFVSFSSASAFLALLKSASGDEETDDLTAHESFELS